MRDWYAFFGLFIIKLYERKYQHSRWPQSSKTYKDFI
jgi:hypothetical protein